MTKTQIPKQTIGSRVRLLVIGHWSLGFLSLAVLTTGCQPTTPIHTGAVAISTAPLPTDRPATADEAVASDESASRLHDIAGAILTYYVENHQRLPNFLEEIKPFADPGTQLNLTSPSSGQPYIYSPAGLFADGQSKRIIVWEPKPNKQGMRWCLLMPHMAPGTAIIPEVVPIPEKVFEAFIPAIQ
jgi:hypothetical protein